MKADRLGLAFAAGCVVLELSACGTATLYHFDGRPFDANTKLVALDSGWVAVDACSLGVHALVELEIDANDRRYAQALVDKLTLSLGSTRTAGPQHVGIDGPICRFIGPQRYWDEPADARGVPVNSTGTPLTERCVYILRAEFELHRLPQSGDSMFLGRRGRLAALRWR